MSGKLGAADLLAATNTEIYICPTGRVVTANVNMCNRNTTTTTIRLAITDNGISSLSDADYFEYDLELCGSGVLERSGLVLSSGQSLVAYSTNVDVSVQVWGWEEVP